MANSAAINRFKTTAITIITIMTMTIIRATIIMLIIIMVATVMIVVVTDGKYVSRIREEEGYAPILAHFN